MPRCLFAEGQAMELPVKFYLIRCFFLQTRYLCLDELEPPTVSIVLFKKWSIEVFTPTPTHTHPTQLE